MLIQIKGRWFMVAPKPSQKVAARVAEKIRKRECLAEGCTKPMEVCGCCRSHFDAADYVVNRFPTEEERQRAREKLIRLGLLLDRFQQPRKRSSKSKAAMYREAIGV